MSRLPCLPQCNLPYFFLNAAIHRHILIMTSKFYKSKHICDTINVEFIYSYVARIDENSPSGTAIVFPDPYVTRVSDDDAGKNGVFSLTLLNNNGTFEISPNVAERRANFVIRVRDNQMLDFEQHQELHFQVSITFLA